MTGRARRAVAGVSACGVLAALPVPAAAACEGLERARGVMGTVARVVICDAPPGDASAASAAADALDALDAVDRSMSLYKPDSDLSRLNRDGAAGPVGIDDDLAGLLETSIALARQTSGAFDVTTKPLMDHYGFYASLGFEPPAGGLAGALALVGIDGLTVDRSRSTAALARRGMSVDLGGIAKGHALDRAAERLRKRGVRRAIVDLGRNLMLVGPGPGDGRWTVGVEDPAGGAPVPLSVPPGAVSTSSRGGRVLEGPGGSVGHVLDPRRGAVSGAVEQATVWSVSATRADALSTAVLIMNPDESIHLLAAHGEAAVHVLRTDAGTAEWKILGDAGPIVMPGAQ